MQATGTLQVQVRYMEHAMYYIVAHQPVPLRKL